jgi:hypothetical protein
MLAIFITYMGGKRGFTPGVCGRSVDVSFVIFVNMGDECASFSILSNFLPLFTGLFLPRRERRMKCKQLRARVREISAMQPMLCEVYNNSMLGLQLAGLQ